jgi:hypothetical protein
LIIVASVINRVGSYEFQTKGSQAFTLGVGFVLLVLALIGSALSGRSERAREDLKLRRLDDLAPQPEFIEGLPAEAADAVFLMRVFQSMPPAFVKRQEGDDFEDVMFNRAFTRFQESSDTHPVETNERLNTIRVDHRRGDQIALNEGSSIQVEYPTSVVRGRLRTILTFKRSFEHNGRQYIAGWYVPIDATDLSGSESVCLREEVDQVVFEVVETAEGSGIHVQVGEAISRLG